MPLPRMLLGASPRRRSARSPCCLQDENREYEYRENRSDSHAVLKISAIPGVGKSPIGNCREHGLEFPRIYGGFGNATVVGGLANAPMRSPGGLARESTFEQDGNLLIRNAAWPSRPQLIV